MFKISRLFKSFQYAFRGLIKTIHEEQNLKLQFTAAFIAIGAAFFFKISAVEWLVLILAISLVILMEIINSAIERVTDVLKPRINSYVKEIKDIMAAAVMLSSITSAIIGLIIFGPRLFKLLYK